MDGIDDAVFAHVLDGNKRFRKEHWGLSNPESIHIPEFVVVGCSDSRTSPEIITDSELGRITAVRAIGQAFDDSTIASVIYPVRFQNTRKIVILAHTSCGAIKAAMNYKGSLGDPSLDATIGNIVSKIPGTTDSGRAAIANAQGQLNTIIRTHLIRRLLEERKIDVGLMLYSLDTGKLKLIECLGNESAFDPLIEGNKRFVGKNKDYKGLAWGQTPKAVVLACSTAVVCPELITDSKLGEMFTVRTVGGVLTRSAIASVGYGVDHLNTNRIVIMPHTECVAIKSAQEETGTLGDPALDRTINIVRTTIRGYTDPAEAAMVNAHRQAQILSDNPVIRKAMKEKDLKIGIMMYDTTTGELRLSYTYDALKLKNKTKH
jgi:carbonic anhydrase